VTCNFPPAWSKLAAVQFEGDLGTRNSMQGVWNPANPVVQALDAQLWEETRRGIAIIGFDIAYPELTETSAKLTSREGAPVSLLRMLTGGARGASLKLPSDAELDHFLQRVLAACRPEWLPVCVSTVNKSELRLMVLTSQGMEFCSNREEIMRYLPDPGAEWVLTLREEAPASHSAVPLH